MIEVSMTMKRTSIDRLILGNTGHTASSPVPDIDIRLLLDESLLSQSLRIEQIRSSGGVCLPSTATEFSGFVLNSKISVAGSKPTVGRAQ